MLQLKNLGWRERGFIAQVFEDRANCLWFLAGRTWWVDGKSWCFVWFLRGDFSCRKTCQLLKIYFYRTERGDQGVRVLKGPLLSGRISWLTGSTTPVTAVVARKAEAKGPGVAGAAFYRRSSCAASQTKTFVSLLIPMVTESHRCHRFFHCES